MSFSYSPPKLKEMAVNERPQERLERHGATSLSDTELIAMLLRSGSRDLDVLALASTLTARAGSLSGLLSWDESDFRAIKGIGKVKALQFITVMEMARRILSQGRNPDESFDSAHSVYRFFEPITAGLSVEKFWIVCLNRKNRLIKYVESTSGTACSSLVHPRESFREAIRANACAIIAVHNHPSGDPAPSDADRRVTRQLRKSADILDIPLVDHVIAGRPASDPKGLGYFSFREEGVL